MKKLDIVKSSDNRGSFNKITYTDLEINKLVIDSIENIEIINCKINKLVVKTGIDYLIITNSAIKKTNLLKAYNIDINNSLINYKNLQSFITPSNKTMDLTITDSLVNIPDLKNIKILKLYHTVLKNFITPNSFTIQISGKETGHRFTMFLNKQDHIKLKKINELKYLTLILINSSSSLPNINLTNCDLYQENSMKNIKNYQLGKKSIFLINS